MGATLNSGFQPDYSQYTLSSPASELEPTYDVIVIGSGYGGSIAANRAARAGLKVCLLEKGKEWRPGDFPETDVKALREVRTTVHDHEHFNLGDPTCLYDLMISHDVTVLKGSGLGGTSLINANVALDCEPKIFEDEVWPQAFRDDLDNLHRVDRPRVHDMLKPRELPETLPDLPKVSAMETAAKHIADIEELEFGKIFKRTPLYVNFTNTDQNHVGVPQPACINCGNCCGGCNTGAKNTLNMNYLPDAKAHGAKLFTKFEVKYLSRNTDKDVWRVHYVCHDTSPPQGAEPFVEAKVVILGGGSLGSTNILLQSQANGTEISSTVGKRFSTNGDTVGFSYNGEANIRPVGEELSIVRKNKKGPGPCITSVIDMRGIPGKDLQESYILEDGTPPSSVDLPYRFLLRWVEHKTDTTTGCHWREIGRRLTGKDWNNSLSFLGMGNDDAAGELRLDDKNGRVWVHYPNVGEGKNFKDTEDGMLRATEGLKGSFESNPYWGGLIEKIKQTKGIITVHPIGGCAMAENGQNGVVNHAGQVFKGDTDELHPGLYVVDGAVMPRCLGVNPSMTISCVAERCMRLLALSHGWTIDYDSKKMMASGVTTGFNLRGKLQAYAGL